MKTQNTVQALVFKKDKGKFFYLLLKKLSIYGGFWQPVVGKLEENEKPLDVAMKELKMETKITKTKEVIELGSTANGLGEGKEFIFAFKVDPKEKVQLDTNQYQDHDEFKWYPFEEAVEIARWPNYKSAIKKLENVIEP